MIAPRRVFRPLLAALTLTFGSLGAQAQDGSAPVFSLELNNAATTAAGGCRLTYVAVNRTGRALQQTAHQVAVFDANGIVRRLLVLEFGALSENKTKIVQFDLGDQTCGDISRIVVNDIAECTGEGGEALQDFCLEALVTQSRTDIQFGT
ncbi:MAG: hypothetical protein AAFV09_16070 [Pseudomonadota bacterium]